MKIKGDSPNNTEEENSNVVAKFVRKEADQGRGDEDTEGEDCVPGVGAVSSRVDVNVIVFGFEEVTYMRAMSTSLMPMSFMWMVR